MTPWELGKRRPPVPYEPEDEEEEDEDVQLLQGDNMKRAFVVMVVVLSGCMSTLEERIVENSKVCEAMGFRPHTDALSNCVFQMEYPNRGGDTTVVNQPAAVPTRRR